jgi:hypothetical protein
MLANSNLLRKRKSSHMEENTNTNSSHGENSPAKKKRVDCPASQGRQFHLSIGRKQQEEVSREKESCSHQLQRYFMIVFPQRTSILPRGGGGYKEEGGAQQEDALGTKKIDQIDTVAVMFV